VDDNHSSRPGITGGLERPTRRLRTGRPLSPAHRSASARRLPIWPCSVRGFACHLSYDRRGALLPHLFTLTRLRPRSFDLGLRRGKPSRACPDEARGAKRRERSRAVCFLCHCPSSCPDRALPGALPCGVRTFLPPKLEARSAESEGGRLSGPLRRTYLLYRKAEGRGVQPSPSCLIPYCSSFL
jgi:hypothetical protein